MNRWKMRGVAALTIASLALAACQNQGTDSSVEPLPSLDQTVPSMSDDMTHESMESSPSLEASPSDS